MTRRLVAGIDPGLSGAVGIIDDAGGFVGVFDAPILPTSTGRRQLDASALASILSGSGPLAFVLVERVGPRPGEGPTGAFSFGHTAGSISAVLSVLGIPFDLIQPAVWKRRASIPAGAGKGVSIATAKRLLPAAAPYLTRVKDDGRAESLLLALQALERLRERSPMG